MSLPRYIRSSLSFFRDIFSFMVLIYLTAFLLENLLPGFISNNLNLNLILFAVLISGFFTIFAPDEEVSSNQDKAKKLDYVLVITLALVGGLIIYLKLSANLYLRFATALASSFIIAFTGYISLSSPETIIDETESLASISGNNNLPWLLIKNRLFHFISVLFKKRIEFPLVLILFFIFSTILLIPKNISYLANLLKVTPPVPIISVEESEPDVKPIFWDDFNRSDYIQPIKDLAIQVFNGGAERGMAASISALLKENGYEKISTGDADSYEYNQALIKFHEDDKPQASIIKKLISKDYPVIFELPQDQSVAGITIILGSRENQ